MSFVTIVALALALAMDATAAAAVLGVQAASVRVKDVLRVALLFGGAQGLMPLAGVWLGERIGPSVAAWDHWIAFGLLSALGVKTIREGLSQDAAPRRSFAWSSLLVLAVATSIDAFAAGVTLPLLGAPITQTVVTIAVVTAALSACGVWIGRRFGAAIGKRLDVVGGVALIVLGVKILAEHLSSG